MNPRNQRRAGLLLVAIIAALALAACPGIPGFSTEPGQLVKDSLAELKRNPGSAAKVFEALRESRKAGRWTEATTNNILSPPVDLDWSKVGQEWVGFLCFLIDHGDSAARERLRHVKLDGGSAYDWLSRKQDDSRFMEPTWNSVRSRFAFNSDPNGLVMTEPNRRPVDRGK